MLTFEQFKQDKEVLYQNGDYGVWRTVNGSGNTIYMLYEIMGEDEIKDVFLPVFSADSFGIAVDEANNLATYGTRKHKNLYM